MAKRKSASGKDQSKVPPRKPSSSAPPPTAPGSRLSRPRSGRAAKPEPTPHIEERSRLIFQTNPDAIAIIRRADGRYVDINDGFTHLSGYTRNEVIGRTTQEIDIWSDSADRERLTSGLDERGRIDNLKTGFRLKNGQVKIGLFSAAIIRLEGEAHVISIARDIDEFEKAQARLRDSEENFRQLSQLLPQTVFEMDLTGRLTFVNLNAYATFGYSEADFRRGLHVMDLVAPADRAHAATGIADVIAGRAGPGIEYTMRTRENRTFPAIIYTSPVLRNGRPAGVRGIIVDISATKQAEEALRISEERHRSLLETMHQGVLELDTGGRIIYANPAAIAILEAQDESPIGQPIWALAIQPDSEAGVREMTERILREQPPPQFVDYRRTGRSGTTTDIRVDWTYKRNSQQQVIGLVLVLTDTSEKTRLEERLRQTQKLEAIGQLAGGVAHDFNNLLTPIIGYAEMLLMSTPAHNPNHEQLREILHAGERARKLTQRLLAFGRKQLFEMKSLNINALLTNFRPILRQAIREDIDIEIRSSGTNSIRGDTSQLEVALMNLVVNAQDAMPGGGRILIETTNIELGEDFCATHPPSQPGEYVMVSVSDTGSGMSEEIKKHLFEPFFTTKGTGRGTGLGLATVYGIAKQHSGYIWIASEVNQGTTVSIYLPRVPEAAETPPEQLLPAPPVQHGQETILLMEDNDMVRQLTRTILIQAGYDVLAPASLAECRKLFLERSDAINLLLSDVVMPEASGPQLYRELSAIRTGLKVLYMSGYTENIIAHHGILDSGIHFIQKPVTFHALTAKVREVLELP
jgi:two-component system, cell cycle sensor histidine kinase and response regulator CckA